MAQTTFTGPVKSGNILSTTGRWTDIGSSDQTVYGIAVTNSATAGVARVVVNYLQARDLS